MNDDLGRRRPRWLVTGWLALPAMLVGVVACGSVHAGSPGSGNAEAASAATPSPLKTGSPAPPIPLPRLNLKRDPWLAYLTDVDPGSAIQFVTPRAGWRIDGQGVSNHLDKHLAAGPDATTFAWPGSSVARSVDGGKAWAKVYSPDGGVWGIDFLSADIGWVVGVKSLARTTDGGSSWQRVAEPSPHPLVAADFVSPQTGYGLTTAGALVQTTNGGLTWSAGSLSTAGGALCFTSPANGYVSGQDGAMYRTTNAGVSWTRVHANPFASVGINYLPVWSSLACASGTVWQGVQTIGAAALEPGMPLPYIVFASSDGGSSWSAVATNDDALDLSRPLPRAPDLAAHLATITVTSGRGYLAGAPAGTGWELDIARVGGSSHGQAAITPPATSAAMHPDGALGDIVVHGLSFQGGNGWLLYSDGALGTKASPRSETMLLHTTDGGGTWTVQARSRRNSY